MSTIALPGSVKADPRDRLRAGDQDEHSPAGRIWRVIEDKSYLYDSKGVAEVLGVSSSWVQRHIDRRAALILQERRGTAVDTSVFSEEDIIEALREVLGDTEPTVDRYRREAGPGMPSVSTITSATRFGSWSAALTAAGIEPHRGREQGQCYRFTKAELEAVVDAFVAQDRFAATYAAFGTYLADHHPKGPSLSSVRNRLGRWSYIKNRSLERIGA